MLDIGSEGLDQLMWFRIFLVGRHVETVCCAI